MSPITLQPNEKELGKWTLNYLPPGGGRYTGPLVVTNLRLIFDAKFETSVAGALRELIIIEGSQGIVSIPKSRIKGVEVSKSFAKKLVFYYRQSQAGAEPQEEERYYIQDRTLLRDSKGNQTVDDKKDLSPILKQAAAYQQLFLNMFY